METTNYKYEASVHTCPADWNKIDFLGSVSANSLKELKCKARQLAHNKNIWSGRISITMEGSEICVNAGRY